MPALSNARHERFAQELAKGKTADQAYKLAGYKPNRHNAARLKTNEHIRARISEVQAKTAEKAEWTAADRIKGLKRIYDATEDKDPRTAISALAEANKMQGSYAPSKHQHTGPKGGPIQTVDLSNLDDAELARLESIFGPLTSSTGNGDGSDPEGEGEA